MKKVAYLEIFLLLLMIFSFPVSIHAQGTTINPPPSPTGTAADPTLPLTDTASEGTTTPDPAGASAASPAPRPTPKAVPPAIEPILPPVPRVIDIIPNNLPVSTTNTDTQNVIIASLAASAASILLFFGLNIRKKKREDKNDDRKCANIKKLMEEKWNELGDLKSQLANLAKEEASRQVKNITGGTKTGKLLGFVEKRQEEYEKLKELYEKCMTDLKKDRTIFIFHGTEGYPEENWFPWLKEKLEAKRHKVFVPQFPTPPKDSAKIDEWFEVLKNYEQYINEDTIFIGHSLGGIFALRILEKLQYPVKSVFLTGTPLGIKPLANYERDNSFSGFDFDWENIKNKAKHFVVFHSDNDPYVGLDNGKMLAKKLNVELSFIPNAGHFNRKAGYTKFEELWNKLELLLKS